MYLDRLNKVSSRWGVFPRLKVWNIQEISCVARLDHHSITGVFGKLGMIDVAYRENYPKEARDSSGPSLIGCQDNEETYYIIQAPKLRRIRGVGIPCFVSNHVCAESDVTSYETIASKTILVI